MNLDFLEYTGRRYFWNQGYRGQNVIVAVIDSGIVNHPELDGRILPGKSFFNGSIGNNYADDFGHGTHVSGTVAGTTCGIAPQAQILPLKALDFWGYGQASDVASALDYIRTETDADIVNLSIGYPENMPDIDKLEIAINKCVDAGIVVICAAGNTGNDDNIYPGKFQSPITVGAVDYYKKAAIFTTESDEVDVCQIGVDVWSCDLHNGYTMLSGTSMATPIVTGIAALLISKYKALYGKKIPEPLLYEMLKMSCIDVEIPGIDPKTGNGFCTLRDTHIIEMQDGDYDVKVDGKIHFSDVAPQILNGRFMMPMRFAAESCGGIADWNDPIGKVII